MMEMVSTTTTIRENDHKMEKLILTHELDDTFTFVHRDINRSGRRRGGYTVYSKKIHKQQICLKELCSALGRQLCTDSIHSEHLSAFVACRLIPLDKCPGIQPIGIGEVPK